MQSNFCFFVRTHSNSITDRNLRQEASYSGYIFALGWLLLFTFGYVLLTVLQFRQTQISTFTGSRAQLSSLSYRPISYLSCQLLQEIFPSLCGQPCKAQLAILRQPPLHQVELCSPSSIVKAGWQPFQASSSTGLWVSWHCNAVDSPVVHTATSSPGTAPDHKLTLALSQLLQSSQPIPKQRHLELNNKSLILNEFITDNSLSSSSIKGPKNIKTTTISIPASQIQTLWSHPFGHCCYKPPSQAKPFLSL